MASLTQPLKWHGGKHYLRKWIIDQMPPHLHYVEPFFGGGSVLLERDPNRNWLQTGDEKLLAGHQGCSEVVNDIYGELTNFWRVLQNVSYFETFLRRVEATPLSEVEFQNALLSQGQLDDPIDRAVHFFIQARQSRQGLMRDFATLSRNRTRSRVNEQVSAWLNVIEGLPDVHRRLQKVVILNQDACDVIRKQDGPLTLFYCDPPYLHETRSTVGEYSFEMTEDQHRQLLETLAGIEGKFMVSGYPSPIYAEWQRRHHWTCHQLEIDNKAASGKTKEKKVECLWCNY